MLFVEEAYSFDVDEADLTPENFDTVNNVTAYVGRRLGRGRLKGPIAVVACRNLLRHEPKL